MIFNYLNEYKTIEDCNKTIKKIKEIYKDNLSRQIYAIQEFDVYIDILENFIKNNKFKFDIFIYKNKYYCNFKIITLSIKKTGKRPLFKFLNDLIFKNKEFDLLNIQLERELLDLDFTSILYNDEIIKIIKLDRFINNIEINNLFTNSKNKIELNKYIEFNFINYDILNLNNDNNLNLENKKIEELENKIDELENKIKKLEIKFNQVNTINIMDINEFID
jgi:hypothetical protein